MSDQFRAADQQTSIKLELVLNMHGIGTPPDGIDDNSSRYWLNRQAFTTVLESIVVAKTEIQNPNFHNLRRRQCE